MAFDVYKLTFDREEFHTIYEALYDARELIDDKLHCGEKFGDYSEADMAEMRVYDGKLAALREQLSKLL